MPQKVGRLRRTLPDAPDAGFNKDLVSSCRTIGFILSLLGWGCLSSENLFYFMFSQFYLLDLFY